MHHTYIFSIQRESTQILRNIRTATTYARFEAIMAISCQGTFGMLILNSDLI
jgi:hypothetical protein